MKALDTSLPPPDVPTGEWHDGLLLGYRPMDDTHQEFVALVTRLRTAPEDELPAVLDDFLAHIGRHFGEEEQWMSLDGYPAGDCHVEEHAAVMRRFGGARAGVGRRLHVIALRNFAASFPLGLGPSRAFGV